MWLSAVKDAFLNGPDERLLVSSIASCMLVQFPLVRNITRLRWFGVLQGVRLSIMQSFLLRENL